MDEPSGDNVSILELMDAVMVGIYDVTRKTLNTPAVSLDTLLLL